MFRDPRVYRSKGFWRQTNTKKLSALYIKITKGDRDSKYVEKKPGNLKNS